ncbi:MAG: nucleoside permease [Rikenellaceae bacterium]|jgi:NHS family xanthosine MFS transporter|nr:nucleoside permease [Bacteroidales bacterium]
MSIKFRLTVMNFLQFFIWGTWLISFGGYLIQKLGFTGGTVGAIYATMGISSLFMPALLGIVADRWMNAEKLLGICHILGAVCLYLASSVTDPDKMYWIMLLNSLVFMPTIALNNSVSYNVMVKRGMDVVKEFPPIRVWGTVGFIIAMWIVDLGGWTLSPVQLYIGSISSLVLGLYAFTIPPCPPVKKEGKRSLASALGLDALVLFKQQKTAVFFLFAMLLGAALQITNTFGSPFLQDFAKDPQFVDSFAVKHPGILMSISQMSETLFILAIPFFLKRFGIKIVVLMSMFAWVLRFGLFGIGNPSEGFVFLILSMIVYGIAFDFFNISGSLFIEQETKPEIRASAQGLFMVMTNGIGATVGGLTSGWVVDKFTSPGGIRDWSTIWFVFATYALVIGILFAIFFKYKHNPQPVAE